MIFNDRLKQLRQDKGLTQMQAAEALGINYRHYQRLECEGNTPNYANLTQIADFFGVSLDYLAGRSSVKNNNVQRAVYKGYHREYGVSRDLPIFSQRIRLLRRERNMTQADAGHAIGLSARGYQDLELGRAPRADTLMAVAEFYQVSMDWLMGRTDVRKVAR